MSSKVFIVKHDYQADFKVFFVDQDYQQKNHQIIAGGKLVGVESQANAKVFIVDHNYQANVLITRKNFPK